MSFLSIILPIYNVELFISACLDSVLSQWEDGLELICVNDGSTDNSLSILEIYKEKYPHIQIINQPNKGLSGARNSGLKVATGKFVFFLDSDDTITSDFIEKIQKNIDSDTDILLYNAQMIDEEGTLTHKYPKLTPAYYDSGMDFYKYHLQHPRFEFICAWSKIYKTDFLRTNNLYFEEGILHEDNLFTPIICYYAKKVTVIDDYLYNYRVRTNSITQNYNIKRLYDRVLIANQLSDFFLTRKIENKLILQNIFDLYHNALLDSKWWHLSNYLESLRKTVEDKKINIIFCVLDKKRLGFFLLNFPYLYVNWFVFKIKMKRKMKKLWKRS